MEIALQIISGVLTILGLCQKQKVKMLSIFTINNLILASMYFCFLRTTAGFIMLIAAARTFIFAFYAYKKIKPNWIWLIVFELAFIGTTILTWQDARDLMLMFAFLILCYGTWQDNQLILRIGYVIAYILSGLYRLFVGAYIAMGVEFLCLLITIISLIYYCILKQEVPIMKRILSVFHKKRYNR